MFIFASHRKPLAPDNAVRTASLSESLLDSTRLEPEIDDVTQGTSHRVSTVSPSPPQEEYVVLWCWERNGLAARLVPLYYFACREIIVLSASAERLSLLKSEAWELPWTTAGSIELRARTRETQNTHSTIGTVSRISQVLACIRQSERLWKNFVRSMVHEVYLLRVYCSAKSYYVPLVNLCLCKRMLDQLQLFEIFYQVNSYHTQIFAGSNDFKPCG